MFSLRSASGLLRSASTSSRPLLPSCLCTCGPPLHHASRRLSTSTIRLAPVELAYDQYDPPNASSSSQSAGALVILHGLYGSKQNWRSLGKTMSHQTGRRVMALDLRNHGTSPHDEGVSYDDYAGDIEAFIARHELERPIILGHSMGGKVAAAFALSYPTLLERLIVVDISPAVGRVSEDFAKYLEAMREVEELGCASKKEAGEVLRKYEESQSILDFLLTNFVTPSSSSSSSSSSNESASRWRISLPHLSKQLSTNAIGEFPFVPPGSKTWDGPTLFIKGEKSPYLNRKTIPPAREYFPKARVETVEGAGHWVHAERPKEFLKLVNDFCAE